MDLLRLLETTSRQISLQKDKTEAIKQQEESLRQELAGAHKFLASKRAVMEQEQNQHFSMASNLQHQEAAIAECQDTNSALKASISHVQTEREKLSAELRKLQDEFVQSSCSLSADVQALSAQSHSLLIGDGLVLSSLQEVSTDAARAKAAQAVLKVMGGGAGDEHAEEHNGGA